MRFAVPKFQALHDAISSQRNSPAPGSFADDVTNLQRLSLAVAIVDHNAVELNGRVVYADLEKAVAAGGLSHFDIVMIMLAVNMGLALTRQQILDGAWGRGWYGDERTVDAHVRQLRKKLGDALPLTTVWGVGYRLG